jgi:hypothetical protein
MNRVPSLAASLTILLSVLCALNCATITRKKTQVIPVTSAPVGATVSVNGAVKGVTPLEVRLVRKKKDQVIRIESPGYNPVEIRLQSKMSGGVYIGNFFLGLIPGTAVAYAIATAGMAADDEIGDVPGVYGIWGGCVLAFAGLFTLMDSAGDGYELTPKQLIVNLQKADGPPRVDTILIDAEDFRNITWIRVHRD